LVIQIDGGARGNPGPAGAGVVIVTEEGQLIHEGAYYLGQQTNNAAEYHALIRGLQRAARCEPQPITVISDSELLVRQVTGEYRVKNEKLQQLYQQVQMLLLRVPRWHVRHVPREENRRADELANLAMDARHDTIVFDAAAADPPVGGPGEEAQPTATLRDQGTGSAAREPAIARRGLRENEATSPGTSTGSGTRSVRVVLAQAPGSGQCPAGMAESFTVAAALPAQLCVHAAYAILPTLLAMQNTERDEFAAIPTLTVRCSRPACGAVFQLSPVRSTNGAAEAGR